MKMFNSITSLVLLALLCKATNYEGYKTYRVYAKNKDQQYLLNLFQTSTDFDFWTKSSILGKPIDIMVKPSKIDFFETFLYHNNYNASVLIDNVAKTLSEPMNLSYRRMIPADGSISFDRFERYDTVEVYLKKLASDQPDKVTLLNIGKTHENRDIFGVKISTAGENKPAIVIDAGIHAREWLAPATALYIIDQLATNSTTAKYIERVDWYIIPILNPDGYEYSMSTDKFWRKNRSPGRSCKGTDLNRNFPFHWAEAGTSGSECSDIYHGESAASEPETTAFMNFANNIKNIKLYLTFHSYGLYMLYPWGYDSKIPRNKKELHELAWLAKNAIRSVRGTKYTIGTSAKVLYKAAGGSDDWMMSIGVPLSYTIELKAGGSQGFNPPEDVIKRNVEETFEGVKIFGRYVALKWT